MFDVPSLLLVLRVHPSVPSTHRFAQKDDVLPDGTIVKAGTNVRYSEFMLHRCADYWDDPDTFNPGISPPIPPSFPLLAPSRTFSFPFHLMCHVWTAFLLQIAGMIRMCSSISINMFLFMSALSDVHSSFLLSLFPFSLLAPPPFPFIFFFSHSFPAYRSR